MTLTTHTARLEINLCGKFKQVLSVVDTINVATLSYPGSSSTIKAGLFKVNGKARIEYLKKLFPGHIVKQGVLIFQFRYL